MRFMIFVIFIIGECGGYLTTQTKNKIKNTIRISLIIAFIGLVFS